MLPGAVSRRIEYLVMFCALAMTLVVTPSINLDPINLPKLLILGVCSFATIGNLSLYLKQMFNSEAKSLVCAILLFLTSLVIVVSMSGSGIWPQVYGAYGRNTGLLAYVGLALMLLSVVLVSDFRFSRKLVWVLIITGIMNSAYGLVQWLGMDRANWETTNSPIMGTLGNPNFLSAHLGIAALASIALTLENSQGLITRLVLLVNVGLSLFVILQSDSSQGFLIFMLGSALVFYFRYIRSLNLLMRLSYSLLILAASFAGTLGILNRGPLSSLLYQESVTYRGDYWRAGWTMTLENPLFGVGLDSYGDWYRSARSETAALRRGPEVISNSAHNVFLDISSNGGLILLITYLFIFGLVFRSAIRVLMKSQGFDAVGVGLVSAWSAYVIQSMISINQLGLAIWGWILGGAIIGYDLYRDRPDAPQLTLKKGRRPDQVSAAVVLTGTLGLVVGFLVSLWPLAQDISFRNALESGDGAKIVAAAKEFPSNNYYYIYSARILQENEIADEALELTRLAISSNPRDFNAWKLLSENPKITESERASAIAKMRELDPFNNTLGGLALP